MKNVKTFLSILCCLLLVTSVWAEKVGENILYKKKNMEPTLVPESNISKEVVDYWKNTYDKEPVFLAEMLYEIPSNGVDINDISKILRSFSTMEGIEYYSNSRNKYDVLYKSCYTISDPKKQTKIPDNTEENANGLKLYMFQDDNSFGKTSYEVTFWQTENEVAMNAVNMSPLYVKFVKAVKTENVCLTLYVREENEKILVYILAQADFASIPFVDGKIKDSLTARIEALFNWFVGQYNEIK